MNEWSSLGKINITYEDLVNYLGEDVFNTLPEWADYPNLKANQSILTKLFHLRYDCRELGYATTREFLARLEYLFCDLAPRYDFAMGKYLNDKANIEKVGKVIQRDYNEVGDSTLNVVNNTSDNTTSNYYDTPKTSLPNPLASPSNATVQAGTADQTRNDTGKSTITRTETETDSQDTYLVELNKIIDAMRSLNTDFINEFEDLFLMIKIFD